ncbi:mitochondrial carrier domain-containing protein [Rhypophila decipiens]|uniref:Mitochondrial glycine transporter n=1 Tax=Rhypophila decipiens TaxID=261697 RepID=A0AAN7B7Y5_9PEZI|nr:mitochondrial carrier domain-containing protein [Rhypophila decipiens]
MSDGARKTATKSTFHFAAGLGSGVLSAVLLQPIDLLKTRVQQSGSSHSLSAAIAEIRASPSGFIPALWRGAVPSALRTGFGSAIYFTSLNSIREHAAHFPLLAVRPASAGAQHSSSLPKLSNTGNLLAGAVARSFAGFILMPLTVLKVRYESSFYKYNSLAGAARDIASTEGLRGFFAGFGATAIRDAPYAGLYVLFYEQSKKRLSALYLSQNKNTTGGGGADGKSATAAGVNFASGVFSGAACSVISNPFDAVKTRIQLQPKEYHNMVHAARRMVGEEGVRALWDGLALRMSRKALSSALAWTVYEELIKRAEITWGSGGGGTHIVST